MSNGLSDDVSVTAAAVAGQMESGSLTTASSCEQGGFNRRGNVYRGEHCGQNIRMVVPTAIVAVFQALVAPQVL